MSKEQMHQDVRDFSQYLLVERGLSNNTIQSYQNDLKKAAEYFSSQHLDGWQQVDRYAILNLLAHLTNLGQSRTTIRVYGSFINIFCASTGLMMIQWP